MNILEKIVARKQEEVAVAKKLKSISDLEKEPLFSRVTVSLSAALKAATSPQIISEFKRKSPSKGVINGDVFPEIVTADYVKEGAAALSVLTDIDFFGGSFEDFSKAREANPGIPMLRKDFMVDEYQLYEAKSIGADIILLIAACLSPEQVRTLSQKAHELGMEVLLEVHNAEELHESLCESVDIVGVNNRNLKTFETSIETSIELSEQIPDSFVKISESGLKDAETIQRLYKHGYKGFLIGETFMKTANPGAALGDLQNDLSQFNNSNPLVL
ncbi:indole-3-glycerol phosphate synthase TrpC [Dyadobacter psychrotolerans]|uniref:Indole-3-glycerol phosphate synthase n=1 Tax=Dyadobacter psychrotolerans TaxID=2541721 RepID=A0A4R5D5U7_9BACT|nr:indole-3-glycerol phosphate synthase TrpC [Dyadobacter psychrotolerans]TDE08852.1 indole-3-glycerol phosphate synthase TrpC [Dyadobacter psychrotolerans]